MMDISKFSDFNFVPSPLHFYMYENIPSYKSTDAIQILTAFEMPTDSGHKACYCF